MSGRTADLFAASAAIVEPLATDAMVLRGFALAQADDLWQHVLAVAAQSPWRRMTTPGGKPMAVETTNCGSLGWVSDRRGYRYEARDPLTGHAWPSMHADIRQLAATASQAAGLPLLVPDACLVNRYAAGVGMGLHQDRDEQDLTAPIVSVSLGLPARFRFGGPQRGGPTRSVLLQHGDVVVWGGVSRLAFHAITPLRPGHHPLTGGCRINLTLRRAGAPLCVLQETP